MRKRQEDNWEKWNFDPGEGEGKHQMMGFTLGLLKGEQTFRICW